MTCVKGSRSGCQMGFFNREGSTHLLERGNRLAVADNVGYTLQVLVKTIEGICENVHVFDFFPNAFKKVSKLLDFVTVDVNSEITHLNVSELCFILHSNDFLIIIKDRMNIKPYPSNIGLIEVSISDEKLGDGTKNQSVTMESISNHSESVGC